MFSVRKPKIKFGLATIFAISLIIATAITGCFETNTTHRRFFSYHRPKHKATVELSENTNDTNAQSDIKFTQAKVNESIERMKQALKNSEKSNLRQTSDIQSVPSIEHSGAEDEKNFIVNDPDSLAAKLSENSDTFRQRSVGNIDNNNNNKKVISYSANNAKQNNPTEKPIITPLRKRISSIASYSSRKPIKIVKVEPVALPKATLSSSSYDSSKTAISYKSQIKSTSNSNIGQNKLNPKENPKNSSISHPKPVSAEMPKNKPTSSLGTLQTTRVTQKANQSIKLDLPAIESDPNSALEQLVNKLEKKIKDNPGDTATVVKLRLIQALLGQYQLAIKDKTTQSNLKGEELANNLAQLVKIFSDEKLSQAQQINQAAEIVEKMRDKLSEIADLKISEPKLCREVQSFGSYKLMPDSYFVAGKRLPVIVYIELEHFISKYIEKQHVYTTELALTIEIIDPISGTVCWRHHDEYIKDVSQNRRRDFYIARLITLPASLPAGKLKLKVTVEDLTGNKVAQNITTFTIHKD